MAMQDDAETGHEMPADVAMAIEWHDRLAHRHRATVALQMAVPDGVAQFRNMVRLRVAVAAADGYQWQAEAR